MAVFNKIEDIECWALSRKLFQDNVQFFAFLKDKSEFALRNQMLRSCGSIMDNVAEGFGREGNKEFVHFLSIAKASSYEFKSQLYRCFDMGLLSKEKLTQNVESVEFINAKIGKLMSYLRNSDIKGPKFKGSQ